MNKYYRGYYRDIDILCVSKDKREVLNYLENTRSLYKAQYTIDSIFLDENNIETLYSDFMIEELGYNVTVTRRDYEYICDVNKDSIEKVHDIYNNLCTYIDMIYNIPSLQNDVNVLTRSRELMIHHMSDNTLFNKILNYQILESPIFSKNIQEYYNVMYTYKETKEMRNQYRLKLDE